MFFIVIQHYNYFILFLLFSTTASRTCFSAELGNLSAKQTASVLQMLKLEVIKKKEYGKNI